MPRISAPLAPLISVVRDAASAWSRHGSERLAASLAFYTLFSLAPILMVVTAIFGAVLGEAEVHTHLSAWLVDTTGAETAATIMDLVANADRPGAQAVTAAIGVLTIVLAATRTFDHFQGALNTIWEVAPGSGGGLVGALLRKLLSFGLVLSIGVFVVLSVTVGASLQGLAHHLAEQYAFPSEIAVLTHQGTNLVVLTLAFALVYRLVPARKESWTNVLLGGLATGILFTLGKHGIAVYLGRTSAGSAYGASGSLVMLLLWMYYSAMIVLGGAELTQAIARHRSSDRDAEPLAATGDAAG